MQTFGSLYSSFVLDVKLASELKTISRKCGSNRSTLVGNCCASAEGLGKDSNLTTTVGDHSLTMCEKYLPEKNEDERSSQDDKINDVLNGDCFLQASNDENKSACVGESSCLKFNECSMPEFNVFFDHSYIIGLKGKRQRQLLKRQRKMRLKEKKQLKHLKCAVHKLAQLTRKTNGLSGKRGSKADSISSAEVSTGRTLQLDREVDFKLTLECKADRENVGNAESQSDLNVISMEISDGDCLDVCDEQMREHDKETESGVLSKEITHEVVTISSDTSADRDCDNANIEEWVCKSLRNIRVASENNAIKSSSKTKERSNQRRRSAQSYCDSLNPNDLMRNSRKKAKSEKLDGKREGGVTVAKVCKFENTRRNRLMKKRVGKKRLLIHKFPRDRNLEKNAPYLDDQVDIDAELFGQVSAGKIVHRESREKDSNENIVLKDNCSSKQDKPEHETFFSRHISCPSELDDIITESRRHFQVQIKIATHKIWCKTFPDDSGDPFFSVVVEDSPPAPLESLKDVGEKSGWFTILKIFIAC